MQVTPDNTSGVRQEAVTDMSGDRMTCAEALALANTWATCGVPGFPIAISWDDRKRSTNKRPLTDHGHLDGTTDPAELGRMFNARSPAPGEVWGVGLWPGPADRVVVDVDIKDGHRGDEEYAALASEHGAWPDTPRALTPSDGWHDWYTKPPGVYIGNAGLGDGIDIRADDGWVVAPGTVTPWGTWQFEEGTGDAGDAPLPAWALERLSSTNGHSGPRGRWQPLDRTKLHPADLAALVALEAIGGHDSYIGGDGSVCVLRPGKQAGNSASIGHIAPGVVKVFTSKWPPLEQNGVYDADQLLELTHRQEEEADIWPQPAPLGVSTELPPFPVDALPGWVRDQVAAVAEFTQTPVDLPAVVALAALAPAAGGRVVVEVRGPWREPTNLFLVAALPPGSRKSAVFAELTKPLLETEQKLVSESLSDIFEAETLKLIAKTEASAAAMVAAKTEGADQARLRDEAVAKAEFAESIAVPVRPRLVADDITPEAAASLLAEQRGRLGVLSAEGGIFHILAGRYSSAGPSLEVFLKGHAGDMLRVDRKNRHPEHISNPALTVGLTVQPEVIKAIAGMPGFRGRGLLARILYALPENTVGRRRIGAPPPPPEVCAAYETNLAELVALLHEWTDPAVLTLTPDAAGLILDAERRLEPRLAPHADLGHIADWASKLIGATARIAGLLHLAAHRGGVGLAVTGDTMAAAIRVGEYFTAHALAVFDVMGADLTVEDARLVLDWIQRTGVEAFTRRDAQRGCRRFKKVNDIEPALELLEEHGVICRRPDPERGGRGRPPAPTYDVNPLVQTT